MSEDRSRSYWNGLPLFEVPKIKVNMTCELALLLKLKVSRSYMNVARDRFCSIIIESHLLSGHTMGSAAIIGHFHKAHEMFQLAKAECE
jgi:hypothetical protein